MGWLLFTLLTVSVIVSDAKLLRNSPTHRKKHTLVVHPRTKLAAKPIPNIWDALRKQSRETLYSVVDGSWTKLIYNPRTNGNVRKAMVGPTNYNNIIQALPNIAQKFKNELKDIVGLLIHDADDLDYLGQSFEFSSGAKKGHLESVLIVAIRRNAPKDPKSPVEIAYASMVTDANVKTQTTAVKYQKCKKKWFKKKCRWETRYVARGLAPAELVVIKNRLQATQHNWIMQSTPISFVLPAVVPLIEEVDPTEEPGVGRPAEKAVLAWLSDPDTEVRIDSKGGAELEGLRDGLSRLEASSFLLQMQELPGARLIAYMKSLLDTVGLSPDQEIGLDVFNKSTVVSFEWFTTEPTSNTNVSTLSYTWMLSEKRPDNNGYDLFMMSSSSEMQLGSTFASRTAAMRTAFPTENGDFSYSEFNENQTPLAANELNLFLDVIRFTEGKVLLGQASPGKRALNMHIRGSGGLSGAITALAKTVDAVTARWPMIVNKFKSSTNVQVQRIVRLGFMEFRQQTKLISISGVHRSRVNSFVGNVMRVLKIPVSAKSKAILELIPWVNEFTWVEDVFSFNEGNNKASTVAIYKHGDPATGKSDWFYSKSTTNFVLTSDLDVVTTKKSSFGGLFGSTKTEIKTVPKEISLEEAKILQEFFRIIAISKVADKLKLNYNLPSF